jgi:hypothetical protein
MVQRAFRATVINERYVPISHSLLQVQTPWERPPGSGHSFNNMAVIYQAQGKYEEVLAMHTKSLHIKTRILSGDSHLGIARAMETFASFLLVWQGEA